MVVFSVRLVPAGAASAGIIFAPIVNGKFNSKDIKARMPTTIISCFLLVRAAAFRGWQTATVLSRVRLTTIQVETRKKKCQVVWNKRHETSFKSHRFIANRSCMAYFIPAVHRTQVSENARAVRYVAPGQFLQNFPALQVINETILPTMPRTTITDKIEPQSWLNILSAIFIETNITGVTPSFGQCDNSRLNFITISLNSYHHPKSSDGTVRCCLWCKNTK